MTSTTRPAPAPSRQLGLAGMVVLHLILLYGALHSRPLPQPDVPDTRPAITWLQLRPLMQPKLPPVVPPPLHMTKPTIPAVPARQAPPSSPAAVTETAAVPTLPSPTPAPAPTPATLGAETPPRSAEDILAQAKRDIGKIDKDLRTHTFQGKLIKAPPNTPQIRLAKAFDEAAAAVPNKWYEKPKVEELLDDGGYGRRIYKVTGANGTYCITVESNHAPDGIDVIQNGIKPKITNCGNNPPPAATTQAY